MSDSEKLTSQLRFTTSNLKWIHYFKNRIQQYVLNKKTYEVKSRKAIQKLLDEQTNLNEVVLFLSSK